MTQEHKNHLRLLEAVSYLRDHEAVDLQMICTGFKTDFGPRIEKEVGRTKSERCGEVRDWCRSMS